MLNCLAIMTLVGIRVSACVFVLTLVAGLQDIEVAADDDDVLYDDFDDEAIMRELEALG